MEEDSKPAGELSPLNAIRVETALSRHPVHRLAKRGDTPIDIRESTDDGEIVTRWEVSHNSKYGPPGPLAYKTDTLIVNRRIEEAPRPIPKLIRLGSQRDICRELGVNEGQGTRNVKNALYQNAGAFITAKTRYRQSDGTEKTLEAGFTRYSVVFTGEKLPDGRKADGVYIILNDIFMQVLNGAMTRPLDYDYLKKLPPAPQRFYELLSYQMYATLKYDRARAKLNYSTFCTYAPLTRYFDWEQVRKQMAKIHAPHKQSGYIGKVDFNQTTDADGHADWIMLYTPGPRARAEYRAFTRRGGPAILEIEPMPLQAEPSGPAPKQLYLELDLSPLAAELVKRDVTRTTAAELVQRHPADFIQAKLDVFDWLIEKQDRRVAKSPPGYLVASIEKDYAIPKGFISRAERQRQEETRQAKERQAAEDRRRQKEEEAREQAKRQAADAYWTSLSADEQSRLTEEALANADQAARDTYESMKRMRAGGDIFLSMIRRDYILQLLATHQSVSAEA